MTYSLHSEAENDLANAFVFYAREAGPRVARLFLDEFERVAELLVKHPASGTPTTRGRRSFPMRVFPYSVVYRTRGTGIRIVVVRHQHRRPGYGSARR